MNRGVRTTLLVLGCALLVPLGAMLISPDARRGIGLEVPSRQECLDTYRVFHGEIARSPGLLVSAGSGVLFVDAAEWEQTPDWVREQHVGRLARYEACQRDTGENLVRVEVHDRSGRVLGSGYAWNFAAP